MFGNNNSKILIEVITVTFLFNVTLHMIVSIYFPLKPQPFHHKRARNMQHYHNYSDLVNKHESNRYRQYEINEIHYYISIVCRK